MKRTIRPIAIEGKLARIPLTKGHVATIDAADVPLVEAWNWYALVGEWAVYAVRGEKIGGKWRSIRLHRVIMSPPDGIEVDHISGDGLDNRRANMRQATTAQNQHNQRTRRDNTSGFKGVSWDRGGQKWQAHIKINGKSFKLGCHDTPESAHDAYAEASARLHGDFGRVI